MVLIDPISWHFAWPYITTAVVAGYILGSIPFGVVLASLFGYGDIRKVGSGNIGATNVLRVSNNKVLAAVVLVLDAGKGAIAVMLAWPWGQDMAVLAAAGAMAGHIFPVWLKFQGGKGVATALGTLLAILPAVGVLACLTWLIVVALFRYSSLSAIMAMLLSPIYAYILSQTEIAGRYLADPQRMELAILITILVLIRHVGNIRRLITGTEPRIGDERKEADG